ncbi:hypothetical protein P7C71_g4838, partial [Lecanoromycetidae sp. Uapishka_2]
MILRLSHWLSLASALMTLILQLNLVRADADFESVRIRLVVESQGMVLGNARKWHGPNDVQILPWDSDIDVQMTNTTVDFLAHYYNMTVHTFRRRDYLLEVNPKYTDPSYSDFLNVIDARWIDIDTGLFIDITAVRPHHEFKDIICSKDQHEEKVGYL